MLSRNNLRKDALARARYGTGRPLVGYQWQSRRGSNNVRFPWIHSREPDFIQSAKAPLRVNHTVVPWCLASRAILKLVDESGGESHFVIRFCRVWLAVGMFEPLQERRSYEITNDLLAERQDRLRSVELSRRLTTSKYSGQRG